MRAPFQIVRLTTLIEAPVERCFLLSLSIDLHVDAAARSREKAIAGRTSGLLRAGETVTWSGRHFGLNLRHTSLIDLWRPYVYFRDIMTEGHFAHFEHDHHFAPMNDGTRMRDELRFSASYGVLGRLLEPTLRNHLRRFLQDRNARIQEVAESDEWCRYLDNQPPLDRTPFNAAERRSG